MTDLTVAYLEANHPGLHRDLAGWAASGVTTVEQLNDLLDNECFRNMWKDRYGTSPRVEWTMEQKREWIANAPPLEDDELTAEEEAALDAHVQANIDRQNAEMAEYLDDDAEMDRLVQQAEAHEDRRVAAYKAWRDR